MKKYFFLLFILFFCKTLFAQTVPKEGVEITKAIPASADAAALGKYGNVPVSPYTGVPNISIPMYTIKSGDLSLPVSISYHSGGIKVEEAASSVGLGWTLNAGGAITRTIRGFADEVPDGFLDPYHYIANTDARINHNTGPYDMTTAELALNRIADGTYDSEADVYNFNFGSYSGKFVMDSYGNIFVMPLQNIKFTFNILNGQTTYINQFIAQTPDGVKYYFGSDSDGNDAVEFTGSSSSCTGNTKKNYATSWFLKKIVSPSHHEINFTYAYTSYDQTGIPSQTLYAWLSGDSGSSGGTNPSSEYCTSSNTFQTVRLQSIQFENGSVQVYANKNRLDLNPLNSLNGAKMIDTISIVGGGLNKLYKFFYTNITTKRLRLDSLIGQLEPTGTGNYKKEKYSFDYNPDPWKNTLEFSVQQDWWGYYNGQGNIVNGYATLVPYMYYTPNGTTQPIRLDGAERNPDGSGALIAGGTLIGIH